MKAAQSLIHSPNVQISSLLALLTNISTLDFKLTTSLFFFFFSFFFLIGTSQSVLQQIHLCSWHAIKNQYYQTVEFLSMKKVSFHTHISRTDSETMCLQVCFLYASQKHHTVKKTQMGLIQRKTRDHLNICIA